MSPSVVSVTLIITLYSPLDNGEISTLDERQLFPDAANVPKLISVFEEFIAITSHVPSVSPEIFSKVALI